MLPDIGTGQAAARRVCMYRSLESAALNPRGPGQRQVAA